MKKTLIALAAVAAATGAMAQATISGAMVLGVGTTKTGTTSSGFGIERQTGNLAFSGSEDLGGGLRATFRLETSIGGVAETNPATTALTGDAQNIASTVNTLGDRGAFMTLSGGFGTVLVGRAPSGIRANFGAVGDVSRLAPITTMSTAGSAADSSARVIIGDEFSNQLTYSSPAMNGFTAVVGTSFVQGNTAAQKDTMSYGLNYAKGPLAVRFNITDMKRTSATDAATTAGVKVTTINASYDFGVARVGVTNQRIKVSTGVNPGSATSVTANVPLSAAGSIGLGYGKKSATAATHATAGGDDVKQTFVGYRHDLSKRTNVQVVYNKINRTATANDVKETYVTIGHSF